MIVTTHADSHRYDREERAREALRGSRLLLVGPRHDDPELFEALARCAAEVLRCSSIQIAIEAMARATLADALVLDTRVEDRCASSHLRRADPTLGIFVLGQAPRIAARLRASMLGLEGSPILDRPAARFEILEFAARAVAHTRRERLGRCHEYELGPRATLASGIPKPYPDTWSSELLRARICYWSDRLGLSARETEVMRGVVRGLKNKEIAGQLELSVHAIKKYLRELLQKLELESRHEVAWLLARTPLDAAPLSRCEPARVATEYSSFSVSVGD